MSTLLSDVAGWVFGNSVHAIVWVGVVLAVQAVFGRRLSVFWRHALWWVVVVRLVMPPLPTERLGWRGLGEAWWGLSGRVASYGGREGTSVPVETEAPGGSVAAAVAPAAARKAMGAEGQGGDVGFGNRPTGGSVPGGARSGVATTTESPGAVGGGEGWSWPGWLWRWIWVLGWVSVTVRVVVQNCRFAGFLRRSGESPERWVRELFEASAVRMGVARRVGLLECPGLESPAVFGLWRPVVLLPAGLARAFSPEQLRHVFLHELAHVRRGDLWRNAVVEFVACLHWFNPIVVWAIRRMRADRELAADALALGFAGRGEAKAYGGTILCVLEKWVAGRWPSATVGILEDPRTVERRIRAIANSGESGGRACWGAGLAGFLALAVLADAPSLGRSDAVGPVLMRARFVGWRSMKERGDLERTAAILRLSSTEEWLGRGVRRLGAVAAPALGIGPALEPEWTRWLGLALERESVWEVRRDERGKPQWAVAVRAGGTDAEAVREGWMSFLSCGRSEGVGLEGSQHGAWWLVGRGGEAVDSVREQVTAIGADPLVGEAGVGEGVWDVAGMDALLGFRRPDESARRRAKAIHWKVTARQGGLMSRAVLEYAEGWDVDLGAWRLPTDWLRDPLVHFSARKSEGAGGVGRLGLPELPGEGRISAQTFEWALAGPPWQRYFAVSMESGGGLAQGMSDADLAGWLEKAGVAAPTGQVRRTREGRRVDVLGIPFFQPFLADVDQKGGSVLVGGLSPLSPGGASAPEGLLAQLRGREDLISYEWETTGLSVEAGADGGVSENGSERRPVGRLQQLRELEQFRRLMAVREASGLPLGAGGKVRVAGDDWMEAAMSRLGDTVTEFSRTGPLEGTWTRRSSTGVDAAEIMAFFAWVEGAAAGGVGGSGEGSLEAD